MKTDLKNPGFSDGPVPEESELRQIPGRRSVPVLAPTALLLCVCLLYPVSAACNYYTDGTGCGSTFCWVCSPKILSQTPTSYYLSDPSVIEYDSGDWPCIGGNYEPTPAFIYGVCAQPTPTPTPAITPTTIPTPWPITCMPCEDQSALHWYNAASGDPVSPAGPCSFGDCSCYEQNRPCVTPTPTPTPAHCGYDDCSDLNSFETTDECVACNGAEYCYQLCPHPTPTPSTITCGLDMNASFVCCSTPADLAECQPGSSGSGCSHCWSNIITCGESSPPGCIPGLDSDGDGISDAEENARGLEPDNPDYDRDGTLDGADPDPSDSLNYEMSWEEKGSEFLTGAVFGDWSSYDPAHDNMYFLAGYLLSGFVPLVDLRDVAAELSNGHNDMAVLNAVGLIPAYGDSAKVISKVGVFAAHNGDKIPDILKFVLVKHVVEGQADKITVISHVHPESYARLAGSGVTDDTLIAIAEHRGDIAKTLKGVKSDTGTVQTIWLEEGKLKSAQGATEWVEDIGGSGWQHIRNNHYIEHNDFLQYGSQYNTEEAVQQLISDAARNGQEVKMGNDIFRVYQSPTTGKTLSVLVSDNGYIVTVIPDSVI